MLQNHQYQPKPYELIHNHRNKNCTLYFIVCPTFLFVSCSFPKSGSFVTPPPIFDLIYPLLFPQLNKQTQQKEAVEKGIGNATSLVIKQL